MRPLPEAAPASAKPVLVIVGPTASGKTALGIELAKTLRAEIVSADSQQVYRGINVGTAKPTTEQLAQVAHHLIDVADLGHPLSAGEYQRLADEVIGKLHLRGVLPIMVGGTGLWVRAVLQGIVEAPSRDERLRADLEAQAEREGRHVLHARLKQVDPEAAAAIEPQNIARTVRALEIYLLTGQKPSALRARHAFSRLRYRARVFGISPPRDELYRRIDARARQMFEQGLVEEVRALAAANPHGLATRALGYAPALAVVQGRMTVEEAIGATALETRHYAKRQLTWFRADPLVEWLPWPPNASQLIRTL